jgi:hypothetical protein
MKITIVKKAEVKNAQDTQCPWIVESMAQPKLK